MNQQLKIASLLVALLLSTAGLYWQGLGGPLLLDDLPNLEPFKDFGRGLLSWKDVIFYNDAGMFGRPVAMLSFALNSYFSYQDTWALKYTNLMIHLINGALVFWLCGRLFMQTRFSAYRWQMALWVAAIWLLTPINVSTVLYTIQRMAQFSTLFMLCGLLSYVAGRQIVSHKPRKGTTLILSSYLLWLPLAALSKENGLLLPLMIAVVEVYFFHFSGNERTRKSLRVLFITTVVIPVITGILLLLIFPEYFFGSYRLRNFSMTERLLTESRILWSYVQALFIPRGSTMGLFHDDYIKSTGLFNPVSTILAISGWLTIITLAIWHRKRDYALLWFGPVFFLAGHMMESTVLALELIFEHRNYLPAMGLYISGVLLAATVITKTGHRHAIILLLVLMPSLHAFITYQRVKIWERYDTILLGALQSHPESARVHARLALLYLSAGKYTETTKHLDDAERYNPRLRPELELTRLIIHCINKTRVPEKLYLSIEHSLLQESSRFPNDTLKGFMHFRDKHNCRNVDLNRLANSFYTWSQTKGKSLNKRSLWIAYLRTAILLHSTKKWLQVERAIQLLDRALEIAPNELDIALIKLRYEIENRKFVQARRTISYIKTRRSNLRSYAGNYLKFYEKLLDQHYKPGQ
jgi:tetratricopeptide (TPR) repeat protein